MTCGWVACQGLSRWALSVQMSVYEKNLVPPKLFGIWGLWVHNKTWGGPIMPMSKTPATPINSSKIGNSVNFWLTDSCLRANLSEFWPPDILTNQVKLCVCQVSVNRHRFLVFFQQSEIWAEVHLGEPIVDQLSHEVWVLNSTKNGPLPKSNPIFLHLKKPHPTPWIELFLAPKNVPFKHIHCYPFHMQIEWDKINNAQQN